jgi:hypothetical protein
MPVNAAQEPHRWTISLPLELHDFILLVLEEPTHQTRLAPILEVNAFVAEAQLLASEHGIALDKALLDRVIRPDPLGIGRFAAAPIECSHWPSEGWIPTRSVPTGAAPAFDWLWFGDRKLTRSFFEDDVRSASALPFNWLFRIRTDMDALIGGAESQASVPLKGLIFHMSRCGSTLLAQMFAAVPCVVTSSEPEPVNAVIEWSHMLQGETAPAVAALRAITSALARDRRNGATAHIIKTDAWHSLALPLYRAAFPEVNWVYLFRASVEVLVSHNNRAGIHTIPHDGIKALADVGYDSSKPLSDFSAQVLARIGEAVLAHWNLGGGMLVDYPKIITSAPTSIANHFDLVLDPAQIVQMAAATARDSKTPYQKFTSDSVSKQQTASQPIRLAAEQWMDPVEQKLRALQEQHH